MWSEVMALFCSPLAHPNAGRGRRPQTSVIRCSWKLSYV